MGKPEWRVDVLLPGTWRGATSALLTDGRLRIVVDTGMPHEAHQLMKALQARGLQPSDIQALVNTHFHVDHVLNNCLFPHCLIYASQESYDWCRSVYADLRDELNWDKLILKYYPETFEYAKVREYMANLRKLALRWWDVTRLGEASQFRWLETRALPEGLAGLFTSGHVPGHVSVIVDTRAGPTVIAGDALLTREHDEQVLTMIPHNRAQFQRDRARLLSLGGSIVPGHDQEFSPHPRAE